MRRERVVRFQLGDFQVGKGKTGELVFTLLLEIEHLTKNQSDWIVSQSYSLSLEECDSHLLSALTRWKSRTGANCKFVLPESLIDSREGPSQDLPGSQSESGNV